MKPRDHYQVPSGGPSMTVVLVPLVLALLSATTALLWDRKALRVTPHEARAMLRTTDPKLAQDRAAAVVVLSRDVRESIAALLEIAAQDSPAGGQARVSIDKLREQVGR